MAASAEVWGTLKGSNGASSGGGGASTSNAPGASLPSSDTNVNASTHGLGTLGVSPAASFPDAPVPENGHDERQNKRKRRDGGEQGEGGREASDREKELETRLINEEYKIWKKNTPFLYDMVMTHALEWPSLTCQFLPTVSSSEGSCYKTHKLLLGTHTSGAQNSLLVASVRLPKDEGSVGITAAEQMRQGEDYRSVDEKVTIDQRINHPGEVNCARYMPQNTSIVATKAVSSDVLVFDLREHPEEPADKIVRPQAVCKGHKSDGYGLAWNPNKAGQLLSGAEDHLVCMWDNIAQMSSGSTVGHGAASGLDGAREVQGTLYKGHQGVVGDVAWHKMTPSICASVGDDRALLFWDIRSSGGGRSCKGAKGPTLQKQGAHDKEVNALDFSPFDEHFLLTGGSDHVVKLWDTRKLEAPVYSFRGHASEIFNVQWSPHLENMFMSGSSDRRVYVWDIARVETEQSEVDAEDGPPELLFIHGGHTSRVSDLAWNLNEEWVVASVADDNILQVWAMGENIYNPEYDLGIAGNVGD